MSWLNYVSISLLVLVPLVSSASSYKYGVETVSTDCGKVNGSVVPYGDDQIYVFLQIPYAEPPVGNLRWTHSKPIPQEKCVQDHVYDATIDERESKPIKCVQAYKKDKPDQVFGEEDCLYLTVRSPSVDSSASLPVLVWIHGGSLQTGYSDYEGYAPDIDLTAALQVVTVNINYRLDVFGFFSSPDIWDDPENPGNYGNFGISDAITALEWVQKNIANFGGNPNSVTILGESSGGTIVLGLLGSERADGLFHKAISLSAPPLWYATPKTAYQDRKDFAKNVGCTQDSIEGRRRCLKNKPILDLIKNRDLDRGWGFYDFPYADGKKGESMGYNVIDGIIVQTAPFSLRDQQRKQKVKVVIGNTAQETGTYSIDYDKNIVSSWQEAKHLLEQKVDNFRSEVPDSGLDKNHFMRAIMFSYKFQRSSRDWWPQIFFDTLTTDVRTTCLNNELVKSMNFNHKIEPYRLYVVSRPDEIKCGTPWSSIHGWDTEALFGYKYYGPYMQTSTITDIHQRQFKDNIRHLIASFCYDRISEHWNSGTSLVLGNDDFPKSVELRRWHEPPQSNQCMLWNRFNMLKYGWQN